MSKPKKDRNHGAIDFWQSSTDLLLALILILLLIIALLMLYLWQLPERSLGEIWGVQESKAGDGDYTEEGNSWDNHYTELNGDFTEETGDGETGRGGNGGGGQFEEDEFHERYPLLIPSSGNGENDWSKAAVYVTVIDGDTHKAINRAGITFELYQQFGDYTDNDNKTGLHGALRYLNTYYPKKVEYRKFETTAQGNFYLPEKIETGGYYFKELTEPEGYDASDEVFYVVDQDYDWPDPYVVSIPLYPSRNIIRAKMVDAVSGEPIEGGSFGAKAVQDIVTADGTRRYVQGAVADKFTTDKDGIAESEELFLGKYQLIQDKIPRYYAAIQELPQVELKKKNGVEPETHSFSCEKTAISIALDDDLYTDMPLAGAVFNLSADNLPTVQQETDASGKLMFTNLEKNTYYHVKQVSAPEDYQIDKNSYLFYVDAQGRVNGEANSEKKLTNYIPRVAISVQDILLKNAVVDKPMSLYNDRGEVLKSWTSNGTDQILTGLGAGNYYILVNNKESARYDFTITDPNAINNVSFDIWTFQSMLTVAAAAILIPSVIFLLIWFITRLFKKGRRKKKGGK